MAEILTEEEIIKRRERKKVNKQESNVIEESIDTNIENHAKCTKLEFESMGRFSTPPIMYFKDYSVEDINDIVMSSPETLIETLVPILNAMKFGKESENFDVSMMTVEDFIETLVALKTRITKTHKHPYMCDCQYSLPEADQKLEEGEMDLTQLQYKSIEDVENEYKKVALEDLNALSEDEWIEYRNKYAQDESISEVESITKESIVEKIKIKEPFTIYSDDNKISFRLSRIADVIKAQKIIDKEFAPLFKRIQNRVEHGVPGEVLKAKKQEEFDDLQKQKAKKLMTYIKAYCLLSMNDKILSDKEKIDLMTNREIFPRQITRDMDSFLDQLKHGIFHTQEFTCPKCGKVNKEELQHSFSVAELLPIDSKNNRDNRQHTRLNIHFGA